jgi:type IV secretory pathway TraG/TraD family ATPase VirD4
MTQAWKNLQQTLSDNSYWLSKLASMFGTHKHLHTDRFATAPEVKNLVHKKTNGLVLGLDRFGRLLTVEATKERPHLGHLAVFGPTGAGKTTRTEEQIRRWEGPIIVNDPKFQLSNATANFRKKLGPVFFFSPSEGKGDTYDPFDGIESERKIYSLAKHLLYVPHEKEPAFTERATKMLTQLILTAILARKRGLTELRPLPYVAWLLSLGGLNDVAREVNKVSPPLAQKFLSAPYHPEKDYEQNAYRISSWDSLDSRLYPLLTKEVVACFNGSDIKMKDVLFSKKPITIYLRWHESDLLALSGLIKFVWEAMINELILAQDLALDPTLSQELLLALEEAGRTGIPNLPDHVSTLRSRKISVSADFQDRSQGYALYGRDRAENMFNNFLYQIYFRQSDLVTAQHLETRCGGKSGFAHSKTEHEGSISTGESEQKIPLRTAQYFMYDMPDDEIIGFWGKRPFVAKRIPRHVDQAASNSKPAEVSSERLLPAVSLFAEPAKAEAPFSWRTDPALLRFSQPLFATSGIRNQT